MELNAARLILLRPKLKLFVCPHLTDRNFWADPKSFDLLFFPLFSDFLFLEINIFDLKTFS